MKEITPPITLDHPFAMGNKQVRRYFQNGLVFESKSDVGYTEFHPLFDNLSPAEF